MESKEKDRQYFVNRWSDPELRPKLSGRLINITNGCKCAQGDVLSECGYSDETLAVMEQYEADCIVAEILRISLYHSVLLRTVNDSRDGCPQDVIDLEGEGIKNILGPNYKIVLAFWRYLCVLSKKEWSSIYKKINNDTTVVNASLEEYRGLIGLYAYAYDASFRPTMYMMENIMGCSSIYVQSMVARASEIATLEIVKFPDLGLKIASCFGISDPEKDLASYMID